jgi:SAM-dependent methyltransferase
MDYSNRARAPMVVVETTDDFRVCAQQLVGRSSVCLEVGCADGITTDIISQFAADVVGIDIAAGVIAKARRRFPALDVRQLDAVRAACVPPSHSRRLLLVPAPLPCLCHYARAHSPSVCSQNAGAGAAACVPARPTSPPCRRFDRISTWCSSISPAWWRSSRCYRCWVHWTTACAQS